MDHQQQVRLSAHITFAYGSNQSCSLGCAIRNLKDMLCPKSQLGNAISYTLHQWSYLVKYLRHGKAEIDTNWVENQIRDIALGRKNWLFMGHEDSGKVHALFYSLVLTCILNDLNPRLYLHYVITQIHHLRRGIITAQELLPHTIDQNKLEAFMQQQIEHAKQILDSS